MIELQLLLLPSALLDVVDGALFDKELVDPAVLLAPVGVFLPPPATAEALLVVTAALEFPPAGVVVPVVFVGVAVTSAVVVVQLVLVW